MTEREMKERNLNAINDWCKERMKDRNRPLNCGWILRCNNRSYNVSISKDGIFVKGDGRYSPSLMVRPIEVRCDDNLIAHTAGSELIYQWKEIKEKILIAWRDMLEKEEIMRNFEV